MAKYSVYALVLAAVLAMLVGNGNCHNKPEDCGFDEKWNGCGSCETTCDNVAGGWAVMPCPSVCNSKCFCKGSRVRNSEGKCVHPSKCPCKENSYYTKGDCVDNCPLTCANHKNPPKMCPEVCKVGCNCNQGFVRKVEGGACVRPETCP